MPDYLTEQIKLLRGAGWIAHADEFAECVRTLRVLNTWARIDEVILPSEVKQLTDRALKPFVRNDQEAV